MYNKIERLASAIQNHVVSGLRGFHTNLSLSTELIGDEIINERMTILKEYSLKGILPVRDLYVSINCIPVDCQNIEKCRCKDEYSGTPTMHFEIPQLMNDYAEHAIEYIGSNDKQNSFTVYTSITSFRYRIYKKRGKNKPVVWIDTTPNENGMYDCFVFGAPLLKEVSIIAIFKDPRQLEQYSCCIGQTDDNFSFIDNEVVKRLTLKYLQYYRQFATPLKPNDQTYTEG